LLAIFSVPPPIFKIIRTNPHSSRVLLIQLFYFFRIDYFDGVLFFYLFIQNFNSWAKCIFTLVGGLDSYYLIIISLFFLLIFFIDKSFFFIVLFK